MNEKKRLVKNTLLIMLGNFGSKMISFILLPLYTSILTTTEYGTFDFIVALSAFLLPVVTFSIHESLFRFIIDVDKDKNKNGFKKIISNAVIILLIGIFFLFIVLSVLYFVVNKENQVIIIYLFLYVVVNILYTFSNYLLRGLGKIKEYAIISSSKNVIQLVINVIVVLVFRLGIKGLLISSCLSELLAFLIVFIISKLWKYIDIKSLSKKYVKDMLKYSLPLVPNSLCNQVINISDRFIITMFMGTSYNGVYSISYKFPYIIGTVYHFFYTAWSESAARVFQQGKEKAIEYYQSLYTTLNNFVFSIIITMIASMPLLFRILIRGNYVDGFVYVPILMLSMYFDCIGMFYSGIFAALKKTNIMATTTMIAAFINILINILLIGKFGLYAAAISTLIAEIILVILRKKRLNKFMNITIPIRNEIAMVLVTIIVLVLYSYNNWFMITISMVITIVYSIFVNKSVIYTFIRKIKKMVYKKMKKGS